MEARLGGEHELAAAALTLAVGCFGLRVGDGVRCEIFHCGWISFALPSEPTTEALAGRCSHPTVPPPAPGASPAGWAAGVHCRPLRSGVMVLTTTARRGRAHADDRARWTPRWARAGRSPPVPGLSRRNAGAGPGGAAGGLRPAGSGSRGGGDAVPADDRGDVGHLAVDRRRQPADDAAGEAGDRPRRDRPARPAPLRDGPGPHHLGGDDDRRGPRRPARPGQGHHRRRPTGVDVQPDDGRFVHAADVPGADPDDGRRRPAPG